MEIEKPKTIIIIESISKILNYQPTDIQRLLNEEHIASLVLDQIEEYRNFKQFSILQSITCGDLDGKRYILDGQHRITAFKRLKQLNYPLEQHIPLVVYTTDSYEELKRYYIRINKNHPINPLEVTETWFNYGKKFCDWFRVSFKIYVKNEENKKCHCPHINMYEMMDYIKRTNVFKRIESVVDNDVNGKFTLKILEVNDYIKRNVQSMTQFQLSSDFRKRLDKCYNKNMEYPCYLGIWRQFEWIEICVYLIVNGLKIESVKLSLFCSERPKIPKSLRNNVWYKRNGENMNGKCYVCNEELMIDNMECGHIIPHVYHGKIELDNLEPICKNCNRDMGIMNLIEYKSITNIN